MVLISVCLLSPHQNRYNDAATQVVNNLCLKLRQNHKHDLTVHVYSGNDTNPEMCYLLLAYNYKMLLAFKVYIADLIIKIQPTTKGFSC